MPIPLNLPNFLNAPVQQPDYSGIENLPGKLLQAYMMPMQMQRQKEEHELKQLLGQAKANYYNQGGLPARINNPVMNAFLAEEQAAEKWGPDSPQAKALRADAERRAAGQSENKVPAQVKGKQMNAMIASDMRNFISQNLEQPYIGSGSNLTLINDYNRYKSTKNEDEKKALAYKLAMAVNAKKLLPEYANLQLVSQGAQTTIAAKKSQEKAIQQGWPESLLWFENNMPKEIQELANALHSKSLEDLSKIRTDSYEKLMGSKPSGYFGGYGEELTEMPQNAYNPDEVEYAY